MTKYLLAFLTLAATAAGQDVVLQADSYGMVTERVVGRGALVLLRDTALVTGGFGDQRGHFTFAIPDVPRTYSTARFRLPLGLGTGRDPYEASVILALWDAENFSGNQEQAASLFEDVNNGAYYGHLDLSPTVAVDDWILHRRDTRPYDVIRMNFQSNRFFYRIPLSAAALQDINASRGSLWSFGVTIQEDPLANYLRVSGN